MSIQPATDGSDETAAEVVRLQNAIACELHAQLALRGETIHLADIPEVAHAVAVRLRRASQIERAPRWAEVSDDDTSLGLDAAVFYGSAMPNEGSAEAADRYPIFDHGWPRP